MPSRLAIALTRYLAGRRANRYSHRVGRLLARIRLAHLDRTPV